MSDYSTCFQITRFNHRELWKRFFMENCEFHGLQLWLDARSYVAYWELKNIWKHRFYVFHDSVALPCIRGNITVDRIHITLARTKGVKNTGFLWHSTNRTSITPARINWLWNWTRFPLSCILTSSTEFLICSPSLKALNIYESSTERELSTFSCSFIMYYYFSQQHRRAKKQEEERKMAKVWTKSSRNARKTYFASAFLSSPGRSRQ